MKRALALCLLTASLLAAQSLNERVLVVYRAGDADSLAVARYYMAQRAIPASRLCAIRTSSTDSISAGEYATHVQAPIGRCLDAAGRNLILYIVFSYRTPFVIQNGDRGYALDQFVADIWDEVLPRGRTGGEGPPHRYYAEAQSQGDLYPPLVPLAQFRTQPGAPVIYSVWRLDAADAALARGLVDKAIYAERHGLTGQGCFDLQYGPLSAIDDYSTGSGDWDIHQAAEFARRSGFTVVEEMTRAEFGTPPAPERCDGAALYAGWYSLNHYNDAFTWVPGAIGFHLDSASASHPREGANWSANALRRGITITSGAVGEPYLGGLPHPDQVFLDLFRGGNVGDALLRATYWLKWRIINLGDPLYRPFPHGAPGFAFPTPGEMLLALLPREMKGGEPAAGAVGLSHLAPEGGTTVELSSSRADLVILPARLTIAAKTNIARFRIETRAVTSETVVRISVTLAGRVRSNTLVLRPR